MPLSKAAAAKIYIKVHYQSDYGSDALYSKAYRIADKMARSIPGKLYDKEPSLYLAIIRSVVLTRLVHTLATCRSLQFNNHKPLPRKPEWAKMPGIAP